MEGNFGEILARLRVDYPDLVFKAGRKFAFRGPKMVRIPKELWVNTEKLLLNKEFADEHGQKISSEQKNAGGMSKNAEYRVNGEALQLLHEVGHAILRHKDFRTDVERLKMERAAWEQARLLCERYNIYYDEDLVEEALDSYRDWLHQRSVCPECGLTRYQGRDGVYHCPGCEV